MRGVHPTAISDGFAVALKKSLEVLNSMSCPIKFSDKETLLECVKTALSSKVISSNSDELAPLAVEAVTKLTFGENDSNVDLNDIKIAKKIGGTIDDIELVNGLVFTNNKPSHSAGGPTSIKNPKIALLQFCLSAPKTDIENHI
jgi:T-complex protein 1 subunit delta